MGLLKKVQASTLMETLVATVLIVGIFVVASLVLNNLFRSSVGNDTNSLDARLIELEYLVIHKQMPLPYDEEFKNWFITMQKLDSDIVIEAYKESNDKTVSKRFYLDEH